MLKRILVSGVVVLGLTSLASADHVRGHDDAQPRKVLKVVQTGQGRTMMYFVNERPVEAPYALTGDRHETRRNVPPTKTSHPKGTHGWF